MSAYLKRAFNLVIKLMLFAKLNISDVIELAFFKLFERYGLIREWYYGLFQDLLRILIHSSM